MTRDDLDSIKVGDSVLGAYGEQDEHTVTRVDAGWQRWGKTWSRTVRLADSAGVVYPARLKVDGAEVLVARHVRAG